MNLAEKPHKNADYSVSSVSCQLPVFRISKPFLSKFITAYREVECFYAGIVENKRFSETPLQTA